MFAATGEYWQGLPSQATIGDSVVMISDAERHTPMRAFLYVYFNDADATYRRARAAGAYSLEEPFETPYRECRGMVEDRWGNTWQIATPLRAHNAA